MAKTIFAFDKYSRGAKDYFSLSREIISKEEAIVEKISQQMKKIVKKRAQEFTPVTFQLTGAEAANVFVVGDFNNWTASDDSKLENDKGTWKRQLNLKPGAYKYRFIIDGRWQQDPSNPEAEKNPFGEFDSILQVKE